ncbi:hypothetical protein Ancab_029052 [Ancistrocladus abbreviatus]
MEKVVIGATGSITSSVAQESSKWLLEQLNYIRQYKKYVSDLETDLQMLKHRRGDMQGQVKQAEMNSKSIKKEVQAWLEEATKIIEASENFITASNIRSCSCLCNANLDLKHSLQMVQLLRNDSVMIIRVYGEKGMGKTTLVEKVAQEIEAIRYPSTCASDSFNYVALVTLPQATELNLTIKIIQGKIAERLGLQLEVEDEREKALRLLRRLEQMRRAVIILDGIEQPFDIKRIGIPVTKCKVVFTSARGIVCEQMRAQRSFGLAPLQEDEAWDLFKQLASDDNISCEEFEATARWMIRECQGSPFEIVIRACAFKFPVFLPGNQMTLAFDRDGKSIYRLCARALYIKHVEDTKYWKWFPSTDSSFPEVVEAIALWVLRVKGQIEAKLLSPNTNYGVYLLYKFKAESMGLKAVPLKASVLGVSTTCYFESELPESYQSGDGWKEVEMGRFFNHGHDNFVVTMVLEQVDGKKYGLIIEGIEIRPLANEEFEATARLNNSECQGAPLEIAMRACEFNLPNCLDGNQMTVALDGNGKRICRLCARALYIKHVEDTKYWKWFPSTGSSFSEVVEAVALWVLRVKGQIEAKLLSPNTNYGVYLLYKLKAQNMGLKNVPLKASVLGVSTTCYFESEVSESYQRGDGWNEVEMGRFFNHGHDDFMVTMVLEQVGGKKYGLIIKGIEIRPSVYEEFEETARLNTSECPGSAP